MSTPRRYTSGVTNVAASTTMGQLIIPDPTSVQVFMEDFNNFNPGDWSITRVGSEGTTVGDETIADATGGILAFFPNSGNNDSTFFQWKGTGNVEIASEIFTMEAGKKLWFKSRQKISDTGDSDFIIGLQSKDTTPLVSPVDNTLWKSDDGDDLLDFQVYKASAASLNDVTTGVTIVDDTYFTVGYYWDGVDTIEYFHDDVKRGENQGISQPTAEMTPTFGVQNGSAAARTMSVDYICCIKEH